MRCRTTFLPASAARTMSTSKNTRCPIRMWGMALDFVCDLSQRTLGRHFGSNSCPSNCSAFSSFPVTADSFSAFIRTARTCTCLRFLVVIRIDKGHSENQPPFSKERPLSRRLSALPQNAAARSAHRAWLCSRRRGSRKLAERDCYRLHGACARAPLELPGHPQS